MEDPNKISSASDGLKELESHASEDLVKIHEATRAIDRRILPILCGIYILQFLDKSLLNYAAAMGIKRHLKGNEFANLLTMFYGGYCAGAPFSAYVLQRFQLLKALGTLILLWGGVCMAHAGCKTYASLMVVRAFLGFLESSSLISLIVISSMYYTKPQQAARMGWWSSMSGIATIIGALLSFGFQHIKHNSSGLEPWQILFLVVGAITVLFGVLVAFKLPNNVDECQFLLQCQQAAVLEGVVRPNQTGTTSGLFKAHQLYEMIDPRKDPFTWPFLLLVITSQIVTGALGSFSVTITLMFGFTSYESTLLQIPPGILIVIIIMGATLTVRRFGHISWVIMFMFVPLIAGCIVLLCRGKTSRVGQLFGLYLQYSGSCVITLLYAWTLANTAGATKKYFRSGLTMIGFSLANIIGPQLFRASTAPRYPAAKYTILFTQVACIPLTYLLAHILRRENKKRDMTMKPVADTTSIDDMTERENPEFRYTY